MYNKVVAKFLRDNKIKLYSTSDEIIKVSPVERVFKDFKRKLNVYMVENSTRRYIPLLPDFIESYNNTFHSSICMRPNDVTMQNINEAIYCKAKFQKNVAEKKRYKIGDCVRLLLKKDAFHRSFDFKWTEEEL